MPMNLAIPEKIQTGGAEDILSWKRSLEFLDLSLFPWKFQTNWSFTPGNSTKSCYTHWNFQGQKPRPMEIQHYFFFDHAWIFHFFFYWPREFPILFFQFSWKFHALNAPSPLFVFFWNNLLEAVTASETEICKLLIPQSTAQALNNEPKPYSSNFRSGFVSALIALQ